MRYSCQSVGEVLAELEDVLPYGFLSILVEYLVAHGGIESGCDMGVSGSLHGSDRLHEFFAVQQARVIFTGDEQHRHIGVAWLPP